MQIKDIGPRGPGPSPGGSANVRTLSVLTSSDTNRNHRREVESFPAEGLLYDLNGSHLISL